MSQETVIDPRRMRLIKYLRDQYDIMFDLYPTLRDKLIDTLIDRGFDATFLDFKMKLCIPGGMEYLGEGDSFHTLVLALLDNIGVEMANR